MSTLTSNLFSLCDHLNTKLSLVNLDHGREDPVSLLEDFDIEEAAIVVDSTRLSFIIKFLMDELKYGKRRMKISANITILL